MKEIIIIVATDDENGIGKNNDLAWKLSADMKFFKEKTLFTENKNKKNAVIMGRNTWESIPKKFRPLPGRENFIISSKKTKDKNFFINLNLCLQNIKKNDEIEKIFIIGGGMIYKKAINLENLSKIFLTKVFGNFNCTIFFPKVDEKKFEKKINSNILEENGIKFQFLEFIKK